MLFAHLKKIPKLDRLAYEGSLGYEMSSRWPPSCKTTVSTLKWLPRSCRSHRL
jgi:hypothetical protein